MKNLFTASELLANGRTQEEINKADSVATWRQHLPSEVYNDFEVIRMYRIDEYNKVKRVDDRIKYDGVLVNAYINESKKNAFCVYVDLHTTIGNHTSPASYLTEKFAPTYGNMFKYKKEKLENMLNQEVSYFIQYVELVETEKNKRAEKIAELEKAGFEHYFNDTWRLTNLEANIETKANVRESGNVSFSVEYINGNFETMIKMATQKPSK